MNRVFRFVIAVVTLVVASAATPSNDRLTSLNYLLGTWTCSYHALGAPVSSYSATYSYDVSGNWLKEVDTFSGGGDVGFYTYDRKNRVWSFVVVDSSRATTIFRAADDGTDRHLWHSIYPDTSMTERTDKDSATQYSIHFMQTTKGKTTTSWDACKKRA